ncbi:MAG TPA: cytochrome c [Alphaproteobacteria bacterium]
MRPIALALPLALLAAASAFAASPTGPGDPLSHDPQAFDEIERGRYLAIAADCTACHTAPEGKPYAGGRKIDTPFGLLVSPNLTPDYDTGIGGWSDDDFVSALQRGIGAGGMHLYPAMPYPYYARMPRADILAIRAFLKTLQPAHNEVNVNQLPFPFRIRAAMIGWNMLFFTPGEFRPRPDKPEEWNRGAYLVEGPGHCGACHTPKNFLGGDKTSRRLEGGVLQGWFSPNLTGHQRIGVGAWAADDIVAYLKTGQNQHAMATGLMSEVVADSTSKMREDDLRAIAVYLRDQPPQPPQQDQPVRIASDDPVMRQGAALYIDACSACHSPDGSGVARLFPALKGSPVVQSTDPTTLLHIVLHGTRNVATDAAPTSPAMPAMSWKLSDDQIAAVLTYVRNSWGNAAAAVSGKDAARMRSQLVEQP